jgi:hypothetical protein
VFLLLAIDIIKNANLILLRLCKLPERAFVYLNQTNKFDDQLQSLFRVPKCLLNAIMKMDSAQEIRYNRLHVDLNQIIVSFFDSRNMLSSLALTRFFLFFSFYYQEHQTGELFIYLFSPLSPELCARLFL